MFPDNTTVQPHNLLGDPASDSDESADLEFVDLLDQLEVDDPDNIDLYALLGVGKTATGSELRAAYRRLSLILHPDKHCHVSKAGESTHMVAIDAEAAFQRVAAAYTILSDPKRRAIYDEFGYKVVVEQGSQLMNSVKSTPELHLEYLRLKQTSLEMKQLQLTQPSSSFSLGFDLTDIFDRYLKEPPEKRVDFPMFSMHEVALAQSITAGFNSRNSVTLDGQVLAHNGLGIGTGVITWHNNSGSSFVGPLLVDTELSYGRAGQGLGTGIRCRRQFGSKISGSFGLTFSSWYRNSHKSQVIIMPGVSLGLNVQLLQRLLTRLELRCLVDPGVSADLFWSSNDDEYRIRLSGKLSASGDARLLVHVRKHVPWSWLNPPRGSGAAEGEEAPAQENKEWAYWDETEINPSRKGVVFGSMGLNSIDLVEVTVGAHCCVSKYSRFSGVIRFSLQQGVKLKLSLLRGTQTYSIPLLLSGYPDKVALGYGVAAPLLAFCIIKTLIYEPYLNRQIKLAEKYRRTKLRSQLDAKRREALSVQQLMTRSASQNKSKELAISGLIVNRALYGSPTQNDVNSDPGGSLVIDVTIPLQTMVENSKLCLPPGKWSDLQGFYDPCIGLHQHTNGLQVLYTFHGCPHEVTASESSGLAIPMVKHRVERLQPL